jgi:hypothetical protein
LMSPHRTGWGFFYILIKIRMKCVITYKDNG